LPGELRNPERVIEILDRIKGPESKLPTSVDDENAAARDSSAATNQILGLREEGQPVWLLYQRYQHDLEAFSSGKAEENIGKKPFQTKDEARPTEGSLPYVVAKAVEANVLCRRGFAYRNDHGQEGLAFLALAAN